MTRPGPRVTCAVALAAALSACTRTPLITPSDGGSGLADASPPPALEWRLPRGVPSATFELPWPNDLALAEDGTPDLRFVPNLADNDVVARYEAELAGRIDGFSTVGAVYFHFTSPVDEASLPAGPAATRAPGASVQLVDVDPRSPRFGERTPITWHFHGEGTASLYWPDDTLAIAPVPGFPLHARTRYAAVVTRDVRATSHMDFARGDDLDAVLLANGGDAEVARARARYAPDVEALEALGIPRDRILGVTFFTTQDPTRETYAAIDRVLADATPPVLRELRVSHDSGAYVVYEGHYGPSPVFQTGRYPFDAEGSGGMTLDADGIPVVQSWIDMHFVLTVPTGVAPAAGFPLALYAHGTGGDAMSFVRDGTGAALAAEGVACMGIDQIFHGERAIPGVDPALAFFDFLHPLAGRTTNRQAAIDLVQQGRMARALVVPASVSATHEDVAFDAARISFFGHSQGGLNGPLWIAADPLPSGAVLSGSAGVLTLALLEKDEPYDIASLLAATLGVSRTREDLVPTHPVLTLAQTVVDVADPINYVRALVLEPRPGNVPRSIFQTQGFVDHFAPDDAIAADAIATGLPLVGDVLHPPTCCTADATSVDGYALTGRTPLALPVRADMAGGTVTGAWMQFAAAPGSDGHFVVFDVPDARLRAARFLGSLARDGMPLVAATVP